MVNHKNNNITLDNFDTIFHREFVYFGRSISNVAFGRMITYRISVKVFIGRKCTVHNMLVELGGPHNFGEAVFGI